MIHTPSMNCPKCGGKQFEVSAEGSELLHRHLVTDHKLAGLEATRLAVAVRHTAAEQVQLKKASADPFILLECPHCPQRYTLEADPMIEFMAHLVDVHNLSDAEAWEMVIGTFERVASQLRFKTKVVA